MNAIVMMTISFQKFMKNFRVLVLKNGNSVMNMPYNEIVKHLLQMSWQLETVLQFKLICLEPTSLQPISIPATDNLSSSNSIFLVRLSKWL